MGNKRLILDKSREILNKRGYKSATVRLVCQELGISPGSYSYHFPNKNQVIESLFSEMEGEFSTLLDSLQNSELSITTYLDSHKQLFLIQEKYRFFYLNLYDIFENIPQIKKSFLKKTKQDRIAAKAMTKIYVAMGVLKKSLSEQEIDRLIDVGQILSNFWIMDSEIMKKQGKTKLIHYMKICCGLMEPYLEPTSLEEYNAYFKAK